MDFDVIVIGAGAAGVATAGELGRRGLRVLVLEARDRIGGRILSQRPPHWPVAIELGAEFIHGDSPALRRVLDRVRLRHRPVNVPMWWHDADGLRCIPDFWTRIGRVAARIPARDRRWSAARFLGEIRSRVDPLDHQMAAAYFGGFNAAPLDEISALSLRAGRASTMQEDFKIVGRYDAVVRGLKAAWPPGRVQLELNQEVRAVKWRAGAVEVRTRGGQSFRGAAAVITLPLGVLRAGTVRFSPPLKAKQKLVRRLGWGHVVRLAVRFRPGFWSARFLPGTMRGHGGRKFGFVNAPDQPVPVWWALASPAPVLTAWAGGSAAKKLQRMRSTRAAALRSLAAILDTTPARLRRWVLGWETHDWTRDPFAKGAYSFNKVGSETGDRQLAKPVARTLFFAGEATSDAEPGTVHGAIESGHRAAHEVHRLLRRPKKRPRKL
jgi:monoamine oxidase